MQAEVMLRLQFSCKCVSEYYITHEPVSFLTYRAVRVKILNQLKVPGELQIPDSFKVLNV